MDVVCHCLHQDVRAAVFEMMKSFDLEPLDLQNRPISSAVALEILSDSANSADSSKLPTALGANVPQARMNF